MLVKSVFSKIPNPSKIIYKDDDTLGFSWFNTPNDCFMGCEFVLDENNNCIKKINGQNDKAANKRNLQKTQNQRLYYKLKSVELYPKYKKVKINKTLFKILSFFNLCEEV